ncbi:hypothetical protein M0R45_034566 [Rubus argutus]|uniref:Phytocyanin domain-containing protein n=1 Tax=Rubus argutus TaxID=59490 RepID=A0AAW1VPP3_RUBAR
MARCLALALIAFLAPPPSLVMATTYDLNWEAGVDYTAWVAQNTFFAGDVLNFHYDISLHNIIIATDGDAFDQCIMKPNLGRYSSGDEALTLDEAGNYYFMCGYDCKSNGMKMLVPVN